MSFRFRQAIVRRPAASYHRGLTTRDSGAGDPGAGELAVFERQHRAYVDALSGAGLEVEALEPLEDYPDAQFVEDVAVLVPEVFVITRPGAPSRRGEVAHIEAALGAHNELARIEAPGTLDGGDVLVMGRRCFIGQSQRSNIMGINQLESILEPYSYLCTRIPVAAGLHLKSSVNAIAEDAIVVTADFARLAAFAALQQLVVPTSETYAANVLRVNDRLLVPAGYPETLQRLEDLRLDAEIVPLEMTEARRMDGGLTCLSLRF